MWECPKCGRYFKREHQSHYCGSKPVTIDEYIERQEADVQPILEKMRETICRAIPNADECISWGMPTWKKRRNIIHFAANKKDIGLYPGEEAVAFFQDRLDLYKTSKGAVRLPVDKPIPYGLVSDIAKWCFEQDAKQDEKATNLQKGRN